MAGLGHIAQAAMLPAFRNSENSELVALVSGSPEKMQALSDLYRVPTYTYDRFEECLRGEKVDAVYVAVPNDLHREYTVRAAHCGAHVLCEKPLAVTADECAEMIYACEHNEVKLMVAYRLHFEEANLKAMEIAQSGELGQLRLFSSIFSMQVRPGNIRIQAQRGGGSIHDIGIYCINAARCLFRDEPIEVFAWEGTDGDPRFQDVDEQMCVLMRFPQQRVATFVCSFNAPSIQTLTVAGTKGTLRMEPAYDYAMDLKHFLSVDGTTKETVFPRRDQFGAELTYFSDCILNDCVPEPDGWEGMQDVRIIEAICQSVRSGAPARVQAFQRSRRKPDLHQEIRKPPVKEPALVHVEAPAVNE